MRIKSYFDSSIPTAMRQARTEFGEDVMLVTSRIASPEFRYLGDYEVVFAVDGSETPPENPRESVDDSQLKPLVSAFGELMRQQFVPEETGPEDPGLIISRLQTTFIDLGIDPAQADALVALIRSCTPRRPEPLVEVPKLEPPETTKTLLLEPVSLSAESPLALEISAMELATDVAQPLIESSEIQTSEIQTSVVRMPTEDEPTEMQADHQTGRRQRRKSSGSGKTGLAVMLVALGFGMFRPVRTSK
jgi:hypothetical protein